MLPIRPLLFSPPIQGLGIFVDIEGKPVRAIVPREVLEAELHSGSGQAAWLRCYEANAERVQAAVRRRFGVREQDVVVLRFGDFGAQTPSLVVRSRRKLNDDRRK